MWHDVNIISIFFKRT